MCLNDYKVFSIDEILKVGAPVIPKKFESRFDEIDECNLLYENDRSKIYQHYLDEMYKYNVFKKTNYNPLMLTPNFCSKSTSSLLKYAMSESPIYSLSDKNDEDSKRLSKYIKEFEFNEKIKQILSKIDVTGNCFCRVIPSKKEKGMYDLQILDTKQVFVISDIMTDEVTAYIVYTIYKDENDNYYGKYLVSEIGKNSYYDVVISNGIIAEIELKKEEKLPYNDFSVFNFVVNTDYNNHNYGVPSYREVIPMQSNYIMCINMVMTILYRYTAPTMYGPQPVTGDDNEQVNVALPNLPIPNTHINTGFAMQSEAAVDKKEDVVSLAGKYLALSGEGDIKPGYLTWDGKLNQHIDFLSKLKNDIGNFTGFPEITKDDSEWTANIVSGKALKLKSMASLEKTALYLSTIKGKLEKLLSILTGIVKNEIVITFQDGIVDFPDEEVQYISERIRNGTMSPADGIAYLDGITLEDAVIKARQIVEENNKLKSISIDGKIDAEEFTNETQTQKEENQEE